MDADTQRILDDALAGAEPVGAVPVARSRSTAVFRLPREGGPAFYVKRWEFPTPADRLRGMFRGTLFGRHKAAREAANLEGMAREGVAVPRVLGAGARRGLVFLERCVLLTEEIVGAKTLLRFVADRPERRRAAVEAVARFTSTLHGKGYTDGSLAPRNLLLREGSGGIEVFKVDVAKARRRVPPGLGMLHDLARLLAAAEDISTRAERFRFLRAYLGGGKLGNRARRWIAALEIAKTRFEAREKPRLADRPG